MGSETIILIILGIISVFIGCGVGYYIATKTKLMEKISKDSIERNKILNDPDLLKEKIEGSFQKLNPEAKGDCKIFDEGKEIILDVVEKDGKKTLNITKKDYIPPRDPKEKKIPIKKPVKKKSKKKTPKKKKS